MYVLVLQSSGTPDHYLLLELVYMYFYTQGRVGQVDTKYLNEAIDNLASSAISYM
jgi:hypothetical protein